MGKVLEEGDLMPEDTKDWPDFAMGQPVAGPGSPGVPVPQRGVDDGEKESGESDRA